MNDHEQEEAPIDLTLKWGTLKGWDTRGNKKAMDLIREYHGIGTSTGGVMLQRDTPRQKEIVHELVDLSDGKVILDFTDEIVDKQGAHEYLNNYEH